VSGSCSLLRLADIDDPERPNAASVDRSQGTATSDKRYRAGREGPGMLVATNATRMMRWMARWTSVSTLAGPAAPYQGVEASSDQRPSEHLGASVAPTWLRPQA
jgi:hypothetical protein